MKNLTQIAKKGVETAQIKLAKIKLRELAGKCPSDKLIAQEAQRRGIY